MSIQQNENTTDRVIRAVIGIILVILGFSYFFDSVFGVILEVVGAILLITAATGFCPLYRLFGNFSTKR